ncbi:hypothetical protein G9A89_020121 [Geosiphon pyriformis]|nr:hypothetical protein G9A89_020121 [Geosiphon pyriformis]
MLTSLIREGRFKFAVKVGPSFQKGWDCNTSIISNTKHCYVKPIISMVTVESRLHQAMPRGRSSSTIFISICHNPTIPAIVHFGPSDSLDVPHLLQVLDV